LATNVVSKSDGNVVFKCAWNNSQYSGICSDCPQTNPSCAQKWIHVTPKECWERHIFEQWEFGIGTNRHINQAQIGKIVLFTTKKPSSNHRIVFGVSRLRDIEKERQYPAYPPFPASWSDIVLINPELTIVLPDTLDINFDEFYKRQWNQGLFRYLSDGLVKRILLRIELEMQKIGSTPQELWKLKKLKTLLVS